MAGKGRLLVQRTESGRIVTHENMNFSTETTKEGVQSLRVKMPNAEHGLPKLKIRGVCDSLCI